ncbi:hypothetical protein [Pseudofulvibacter geojedonensis]|uniref:Uncharacterized protein n=1 Tax=Pseudofulvibacter geojedonensis TaxID=1123758 RepID=A0ABW3HZK7_9FLAO
MKKKNVYKDELIKQLNIDLKQTKEQIVNNLYSIKHEQDEFPEQYGIIDSLAKKFNHHVKNLETKILELNNEDEIRHSINMFKKHILKTQKNKHLISMLKRKIKTLEPSENELDIETHKQIIILKIKKFELEFYQLLNTSRSCGAYELPNSSIKVIRKNDSIVKFIVNSEIIRHFPNRYDYNFIYLKNISGDNSKTIPVIKKENLYDVYSFEIKDKENSSFKLDIDIVNSHASPTNATESFSREIKIGEQRPFTLLDTIYK